MQERRKAQRKNLMAYSQVFDLYSGHLIGYLGDLHLQGAMIIGQKLLDENTIITLAIELPELLNTSTARITIPARVVWCQPDLSPEFFNIGFEFQEVRTEQADLIQSIMDQYEFRRTQPPMAKPTEGNW
jgi:hypothetical protein